jgi:hypothetical protein
MRDGQSEQRTARYVVESIDALEPVIDDSVTVIEFVHSVTFSL